MEQSAHDDSNLMVMDSVTASDTVASCKYIFHALLIYHTEAQHTVPNFFLHIASKYDNNIQSGTKIDCKA